MTSLSTFTPAGSSIAPYTGAPRTGAAVPHGAAIPTGAAVPHGAAIPTGAAVPHGAAISSGAADPLGATGPSTAAAVCGCDHRVLIPSTALNNNNAPTVPPHIPIRTVYSLTVHDSILSISTIARIFLTVGANKATAAVALVAPTVKKIPAMVEIDKIEAWTVRE